VVEGSIETEDLHPMVPPIGDVELVLVSPSTNLNRVRAVKAPLSGCTVQTLDISAGWVVTVNQARTVTVGDPDVALLVRTFKGN